MLKSLQSSRKRIQSRLSSLSSSSSSSSENAALHSSSSEPAGESSRMATVDAFVHQACGGYKFQADSSPRVTWSSAGYQSRCPFGDINVFQADKHHVFSAVISCIPTAQGGRYLQRHIQRELQSQMRQQGGNVQAALPAALRALNQAFRDMHPFNGSVFEGVKITLAYIDAKTKMLHAASNGGCRLVIGRRLLGGGMHVLLDLGRPDRKQEQQQQQTSQAPSSSSSVDAGAAQNSSLSASSSSTIKAASAAVAVQAAKDELSSAAADALTAMKYASVQLRDGIDTVILGSEGLWHELPSDKAVLRLRHYYDSTPEANGGNAAMHLANFALHAVAARSTRTKDPRMRSLRSVSHLQSLYSGDRSLYKWGKRQPVRRRRGDVHGDLSAIVLNLDWSSSGAAELSQHSSGKASRRAHAALHAMLPLHRATSAASLAVSERAQKRWDLLRMHFLEFPVHSRALTRQKWHAVIEAALERKRELKHRHQAAEKLLKTGLFSDGSLYRPSSPAKGSLSPLRSRSASGGWQPASRNSASSRSPSASPPGSLRAMLRQGLPKHQSLASEDASKGQPLAPDSKNASVADGASPQASQQSSSTSSFMQHQDKQQAPAAVSRTVSRRNLMAPQQAPSLPVVMERGESQALSKTVKALHDLQLGSSFAQAGQPDARSQDWQQWLAYQKSLKDRPVSGQSPSVRAF